jgi:hypothetical protein
MKIIPNETSSKIVLLLMIFNLIESKYNITNKISREDIEGKHSKFFPDRKRIQSRKLKDILAVV